MVRNENAGDETFPSWHPVSLTFDNRVKFNSKYEYFIIFIFVIT